MWITHNIAARTFVWFAAMAIPLQGVPTAECGCTSNATCSNKVEQLKGFCCASSSSAFESTPATCCGQKAAGPCRCTGAKVCRCSEASLCHQQSRTCCSVHKASNSCCSGDKCATDCSCGDNCQCGKNNTPAEPAAPPAGNSSPERILVGSAEAASSEAAYLSSLATRQHLELSVGMDALSALDRCVTLCRFTI